jgi:2-methylisocitrate lyase-like PEP mutase family enzyme
VVGGSIEDATGDAQQPIYDFDLAVERVHAAAEVARSLPFLHAYGKGGELPARPPRPRRHRPQAQAFERAGADVLYAPGLRDLEPSPPWPRPSRSRSTS